MKTTAPLRTVNSAASESIACKYLKSRFITNLLSVLFVIVASISSIAAQGGGHFYVADTGSHNIAVYDQNLVFQHYISGGFSDYPFGLDFLPNGNLVTAWSSGRVIVYEPSGTVASVFTHPNLGMTYHKDVKAGPSDLLYVTGTDGIMEFTTSGTLIRTFPTLGNTSIAVLPGNILWAAGSGLPDAIDVFDLVTGNRTATISLENGRYAGAMSFSPSTNTVLVCSSIPYELTLSGEMVRNFPGGACSSGITRGSNGDVVSASLVLLYDEWWGEYYYVLTFERWNANGEYLGSTDLGASPGRIAWAPHDIPDGPVNHPPVLSNVPSSATVTEGQTYSFTAAATDPDGDVLRFSIKSDLGGDMESLGASLDPVTGVFTWTPPVLHADRFYGFDVLVRDDYILGPNYASKRISITVNAVNTTDSPPVLGTISNLSGYTRSRISFTATATDPDIPANTLTFSLIGAPAGASINATSGVFQWTPTNNQVGQFTFTVRVSDNGTPIRTDEQAVTATVSRARGR